MTNPAPFTIEDARNFAQRQGLMSLLPKDMQLLADAMNRMYLAGQTVARAPSKFDAPAHVFKVRTPQH